jgi:PEP-CTERM motif
MRFFNLSVKLIALLVLFFAVVTPSWADKIPVRGGSTYGDNAGFSTCSDNITVFLNTNVANNCEGFISTTFTINGNTYNGAVFAFLEPGGTDFGILDILQLGGNSSLALSLLDPSAPTGVFMCGSFGVDDTVVQDSTPAPMTGLPCTAGSSSGGYFNPSQDLANVQANFSATGVTFVNGNSTAIAVFTEHGNIQGSTTATPEPSTLMLLGVGLLSVGRRFRRTGSS